MGRTVGAARFQAECLRLIDEMGRDGQTVTITKRSRPVALLTPVANTGRPSSIGAMAGAVLRYDDPFEPALLPGDFHSDPGDRIIVATARKLGAPLLTAHRAVLRYGRRGYVDARQADA